MKRLKLASAVVLILALGFTGFSQVQNNTKKTETADELLGKFFEYFVKEDFENAFGYLSKAIELDSTKKVYVDILVLLKNGNYAEALKLLEQRKAHSPGENEGKVIQILAAVTHFRWAKDLEKKYRYLDAIEHYEAAYVIVVIYRHRDAAVVLNNIGFLYSALGRKQEALEYYEKALPIRREVGDRSGEATTLNNIGLVYDALGRKQEALEYYEKALPIYKSVGDRSGQATTLNNIGMVYDALGRKQEALEYYEKALPIFREVGYQSGEAATLNNIGMVYDALDRKQEALEFYEKALPILREVGDRSGEATTLNNIGKVYDDLGQKQEALEYYEKALPISREVGDRSGEATTLNNIAAVYDALGRKQEALEYYEKALPISREVGGRSVEATTLNNIGMVYSTLSQKQKAMEYYENALPILQEIGDKANEALVLSNLMVAWNKMKKNSLAIFYGKQSVNCYQQLRQHISGLEKDIKTTYLKSQEDTYRDLASLLVTAGRLPEAQYILDMLKGEEFFAYIRRDRDANSPVYAPIDFTRLEKEWLEKHQTLMKDVTAASSQYHELYMKPIKTPQDLQQLASLEKNLTAGRKAYTQYLDGLKKAFFSYDETSKKARPETGVMIKHAAALQTTLRSLDQGENVRTAAVHYLVTENKVIAILTTPHSQTSFESPVDSTQLNSMIQDYRLALLEENPEQRGVSLKLKPGLPVAGSLTRLYEIIFHQVDEQLKIYGATNLIVYLDGVLRYLPLPALWDGQNFLVQRYRMAVFTVSSLDRIKDIPTNLDQLQILGMGASKGGGEFLPLPDVKEEIRAIVNDKAKGFSGLIKGKALLDEEFTRDTMEKSLKYENYPLVHIASHFKFSGGDETHSVLLLGDGSHLPLSELRLMGNVFDKVDLLVLAACQTGVGGGNGQEIDGFGELAQECGAKGVIATLWQIKDEYAKNLVVKFYGLLGNKSVSSKIEALRQAQLQVAGLPDLLGKKSPASPGNSSDSRANFHDAYRWGPFIMIGNWR
jgi:CHAT domain-containing protein/Tfp pilus assembly protein PilF